MSIALILVDIQNDFLPGGKLSVPHSEKILPVVEDLVLNNRWFDYIVSTQDWHPKNHVSFKKWPSHCVMNSFGAKLHKGIDCWNVIRFKKGSNKDIDSYSIFKDEEGNNNEDFIKFIVNKNVDTVFICGLALDYCVKETALDAVKYFDMKTFVITDACCSTSLDGGMMANTAMLLEGVGMVTSAFLKNNVKI